MFTMLYKPIFSLSLFASQTTFWCVVHGKWLLEMMKISKKAPHLSQLCCNISSQSLSVFTFCRMIRGKWALSTYLTQVLTFRGMVCMRKVNPNLWISLRKWCKKYKIFYGVKAGLSIHAKLEFENLMSLSI